MRHKIPAYTARPTARLEKLVEVLGGISKTATIWGLEYNSIRRFFEGRGGLSAAYVATILERTGLTYEELFQNVEEECKPSN